MTLPPVILEYADLQKQRCHRLLKPLRVAAFVALLAWGYYLAVTFRCWNASPRPDLTLLVTTVCVGPLAAIFCLGMHWQRYGVVVLLAIVIPAAAAEAQGTLEEWMFVSSVKRSAATGITFKAERWWPNRNSYLWYDPASGRLDGGD